MKFFIDTADLDEIKQAADMGLLDGVTTNPSLIAKSGRNILAVLEEICALVPGPVSGEVTATEASAMITECTVLLPKRALPFSSFVSALTSWENSRRGTTITGATVPATAYVRSPEPLA